MVDPDLVTKKPSGRKSTTPVPTTPPPIPMETNDNAVYERQISPHRSGRSTPKANRKRREGAKTPVSETNNEQIQPLVPEMTPEIQRKPPKPKNKGEEENVEVAKQMKRRLSRKERNVKTPDPNFVDGGDHTKHIPAERPMTPRQARAPSPEERPLVVPLPPPRVQDIPLPPVRGESLERPHQKVVPPRNESLERPPKSPVSPKSPAALAEPLSHSNEKPPLIPPHATEQANFPPSAELKEPVNQVSIPEKLPALPPRPAPVQAQVPEVIETTTAPPPPPRSLPTERTQEEIESKKREIEAKKKQMAEALKVLKQLESTVTPDKINVVNYDQPVHEVQPLEIALPSLAQAKEGVRNSGLFTSAIEVNVPPVTAVQPEVKKPEPIEAKSTHPTATITEPTSAAPSTSLIRQEQAQDLNEDHQAKQPLKKEAIENQINERADSSKQIERIAHEGQGQQKVKVGSMPVQDSELEKRPRPSETMSQGKAADNQMNLFSAKQEPASQKTTNDAMHPVSAADNDKSIPDVNGTTKTDESRALINSLPKPFQANNIPNDEEIVSESPKQIRVEKAQEPLHIETQPMPSITQQSLEHTPESTLPSPQSVPVTPPSSDSPQNVPKYHLLQRPEKRDNRDSKVIKAAAYWNTYIGEVMDKKKPPDNVKSLEKPKKIVTAGVGPKGYNDLKTAFESKTSTPKQEESSINVSPSSTAVGGMQRRNSRKIPIEGCSPGLKLLMLRVCLKQNISNLKLL